MTNTEFLIGLIGVAIVVIIISDIYPQLTVKREYRAKPHPPTIKKRKVKIKRIDKS